MDSVCIRHTELPHSSQLFLDYLYRFDKVQQFYAHAPFSTESYAQAQAEMTYPTERRASLVQALAAQNGPSENLALLARPDTAVVVTGQQVGLFSGPSYTIYKALTAVRLAGRLRETGIPAVPVFWLATQDHDFDEVNHCWVFGGDHQPASLRAASALGQGMQPVGGIPVKGAPVEELRRKLQELPHGEEIASLVAESYCDGQTMGTAFASLLQRLLGRYGLLFLDPMRQDVRQLGAPLLREAVQHTPDLMERLFARNRELAEAGYHAQVHLEDHTSLVFLMDNGQRLALRRNGQGYTALRKRYSPEGLMDRAVDLSPNALLRPVMQDYILPTLAYVGGPAELAYLAQSERLYLTLLGRMPVVAPRQGFTVLDGRAGKLMGQFRLRLRDFFQGDAALRDRISAELTPPGVAESLRGVRAAMEGPIDRAEEEFSRFDPTLKGAFEKSRRKIEYQIAKIEGKAAREAMRRDERATAGARRLCSLIYPNRHLQERLYSFLPFLAKHGMDLLERVYEESHPECPDHHLLVAD